MTQQEFTERTGYTPATREEYQAIEAMYMSAGNMDKDEFCQHWKMLHDNNLVRTFYYKMRQYAKENERLQRTINEAAAQTLQYSKEFEEKEFDNIALMLVGQREVAKWKLQNQCLLSDRDKEYLLDLL